MSPLRIYIFRLSVFLLHFTFSPVFDYILRILPAVKLTSMYNLLIVCGFVFVLFLLFLLFYIQNKLTVQNLHKTISLFTYLEHIIDCAGTIYYTETRTLDNSRRINKITGKIFPVTTPCENTECV